MVGPRRSSRSRPEVRQRAARSPMAARRSSTASARSRFSLEMGAPFIGDRVELLGAVGLRRQVADVLQIGQRRVDDARARAVPAGGLLLDHHDDLVAVPRLLRDQGEDDEAQVVPAPACGRRAACRRRPPRRAGPRPRRPNRPRRCRPLRPVTVRTIRSVSLPNMVRISVAKIYLKIAQHQMLRKIYLCSATKKCLRSQTGGLMC